MQIRHAIESCDQGREDQDMTWLDGPVASVKGKLEVLELKQDLVPMDEGNGEKQV